VVIGSRDPRAIDIMLQIYAPLHVADVPFVVTDVESAELIKYASNGFLATKISFINEIAMLCEALGADVRVVARGMGLDSRIGPLFLHPGPGFGGSCFPKDTRAVAQLARQNGTRFRIIEAVLEANEATQERMLVKIEDALGGLDGRTVGVLGLSFKPDTDDIRESPALPIVGGLLAGGATVRAYDPEAMDACRDELPDVVYCDDAYDAATGCDALVILTEWNEFRALELQRLKKLLRKPLVIDLRNVYSREQMAAAKIRYVSVGRGELPATPHPDPLPHAGQGAPIAAAIRQGSR
jgi:UDPglucose 6-dehydrogenase